MAGHERHTNMRVDVYTKAVLTVIAVLLWIAVLRPAANPPTVQAQSDQPYLYVEPGTTVLRKPDGSARMEGKVVIDLRTGGIWGYPTLSNAPYPIDTTKSKPPVSEPMYLGRFDFSKIRPME